MRHKILLHTGDLKIVGASQWEHHLRVGNLTQASTSEQEERLLRSDPLIALVRAGLKAFEDEATGELRFEQAHRTRVPRRLPDGPPVSAQSTWLQTTEAFLLHDGLTRYQVDELTRALKPCVQIPDLLGPKSRLVDPGVTLYR